MKTAHTDLATNFETEICSRCGGCGEYSYCQTHGTRCFKCSGKGLVYTKRALAAIDYARELRTVQVQDVQVGWLMYVAASPLGGKAGWLRVTEAMHDGGAKWLKDGEWTPYVDLSHAGGGQGFFLPTDTLQAVPNRDKHAEVRAAALAYQTTLTKAGTVRKAAR